MSKFLATIDPTKPLNLNLGSVFNENRWVMWCRDNVGKQVRIERSKPIRTLTQNAFMWAWLSKLELETGNASEDMHEYLKHKFLPKRLIHIKGKKGEYDVEVLKSTTKLDKLEFGEYLDKCAAHTGVPLPTKEEISAMGYISNT